MASASINPLSEKTIEEYLTIQIKAIVDEEAKAAAVRVEKRVHAEADSIALKLLSHYSIRYEPGRLIIEVIKDRSQLGNPHP